MRTFEEIMGSLGGAHDELLTTCDRLSGGKSPATVQELVHLTFIVLQQSEAIHNLNKRIKDLEGAGGGI